jgi:hypothetical protein
VYFQLQVSALPTEEIESGLLPTVQIQGLKVCENRKSKSINLGLLPTPKTFDAKKQRTLNENGENVSQTTGAKYGVHLTQLANAGLLPTPTTQEPVSKCEITETGRRKTKDGKGSHSLNLGRLVGMLPTPQARDYKGSSGRAIKGLEKDLPTVAKLLPTPTANCYKGGAVRSDPKRQSDTLAHHFTKTPGKTSQLNPRFVAEMMSFPVDWTELPFLNGETKA